MSHLNAISRTDDVADTNKTSAENSSVTAAATAVFTKRIIKRKFNQDAVETNIVKNKIKYKSVPKPVSKTIKSANKPASTSSASSSVSAGDVCLPAGFIPAPQQYQPPLSAPSVVLSIRDKSKGLSLSKDQLTCYGSEGGFKMIRATHGVHSGSYYFEVQILNTPSITTPPQDSSLLTCNYNVSSTTSAPHYRIGWASRQAELEGPLGYDKFGYAYRDILGSKIHQSQRDDSYGHSYGPGDVIGCFIRLDDRNDFTGAGGLNANNEIRFFKNGQHQGVAFSGFPIGLFFPAVSIYMNGAISVNFGPSFIYKHDMPSLNANPISEIQPMNPSDRKLHEVRIAQIRQSIADQREQERDQLRKEQEMIAAATAATTIIPTPLDIHPSPQSRIQ